MKRRTGRRTGWWFGGSLVAVALLSLMNLVLPMTNASRVATIAPQLAAAADRLESAISGLLLVVALFMEWERIFFQVLRWLLAPMGS